MRKYLFIFKTEIINNLHYITNILIGFIGYIVILYIFLNLWKYIYSDPNELINGYSINQMIWYVIVTEVLWSIIGGRKYCNRIIDDIKAGNIAYNITKPYNYILYCLSTHLGTCSIKAIMYVILGLSTGYIFLGSFPNLNILSILAVLLTCILAIIINTLIITSIGLFAFIIEDAKPFYWIYSKFNLVLGTIFPIEYFPKVIQPILKYTPIYVVSYGPAKLFVDFTFDSFIKIFIVGIIYLIISYSICSLIYHQGVKKLNVNGG